MTEDHQPRAIQPTGTAPEPVEKSAEPRREGYPALLESLAALGLLLIVAYTCWRLYGAEITNMFAVLFQTR